MKARIFWEGRNESGSFIMTDVDYDFQGWCSMVGDKFSQSGGHAWMIGSEVGVPLNRIVRIEKLED